MAIRITIEYLGIPDTEIKRVYEVPLTCDDSIVDGCIDKLEAAIVDVVYCDLGFDYEHETGVFTRID